MSNQLPSLLGAALSVVSCATPLGQAIEAFEEGRLPEAAQRFRSLAHDSPHFTPAERARYALYAGLSELALGDMSRADRWLIPLKRALDENSAMLTAEERSALLNALRSGGHMPGEP
ncbi:MAG: hypothetical protein ACOY0T_01880 [Myxococcota bacterium]